MFWAPLLVLGRILAETGSPRPTVDDPAVLLIKRHNVAIGCTPGDGGPIGDASIDAPIDAPGDAAPDAPSDAGGGDAPGDAGECEVVPTAVTLIVQPHVTTSSDGTRFAVLLVTPARPIVELESNVFEELAALTAPKIETETIEVADPALGTRCRPLFNGGGCGGGNYGYQSTPDTWTPPPIGDAGFGDGAVVEETIGPYQFVRAQPTTTAELAGWLDQLGYAYMTDDLDAVAPYISLGFHVVAIRVAADPGMSGALTPIALTWPGEELRIAAALGRGSVASAITVYIAAEQKYVLPGARVPYSMHVSSGDMGFLTRNELVLDQTKPPATDPIAVHTDNDQFEEIHYVTEEVHVPVEVECDSDLGCCRSCNTRQHTRFDWGVLALAVLVVLRRRRRR